MRQQLAEAAEQAALPNRTIVLLAGDLDVVAEQPGPPGGPPIPTKEYPALCDLLDHPVDLFRITNGTNLGYTWDPIANADMIRKTSLNPQRLDDLFVMDRIHGISPGSPAITMCPIREPWAQRDHFIGTGNRHLSDHFALEARFCLKRAPSNRPGKKEICLRDRPSRFILSRSAFGYEGTVHMHLVVGIGNIGAQYDNTRHNVGFMVIDLLAERNRIRISKKRRYGTAGTGRISGHQAALLKPTTYVNRSGLALDELQKVHNCELSEIMIVCDDMSLEVGAIRMRRSGGTGGHNGLESISDWLDSEAYPRLRIGIGDRGAIPGADYVLSEFKRSEKKKIDSAIWDAAEAVELWVREGIEAAMNRHN